MKRFRLEDEEEYLPNKISKKELQKTKEEPKTRCQILSEQFLSLVLMFSNRVEYLLSKYFISLDDEAFEGQMNIALAKELRIYYNNKVKSEAKLSFDPNDFILNIDQIQLREYAEFLLLLAGKEFNYIK